jgi:hypothetical protein
MNGLMKISLSTAFLLAAFTTPANAAPVTGATPCAVITNYLDQNDKPGIDGFVAYTVGQFNALDAKLAAKTGHGILNLLSVGQINDAAAMASLWCSTHPSNNAQDAATFAYDGVSELGLSVASSN